MAAPDPIDPGGSDLDVAAAELALGLLDGEERAAASRRLLADPGFVREVAWWRDHFAALFAAWPEVAPPPEVERRVNATLDGEPSPASAGPVDLPAAADRSAASRWRLVAAALAACLVAAIALGVMTRMPPPVPPQPAPAPAPVPAPAPEPLLAAITPTDAGGKATPLAVTYDNASGEMRLSGELAVPAQRSAQLWVIGSDKTPRSLGLLQANGATRLSIDAARRGDLIDGVTLAISIEPAGGSPGPLPTGPVVATGALLKS